MTNIFGNNLIIADSDALIGLIYPNDALHRRCVEIYQYLKDNKIDTFSPYATVLEAATVLARLNNRPDLAKEILSNYLKVDQIVDWDVYDLVVELYNPKTSKKNTPFDHYVLALAKKNNIKHVFSFDEFYKKKGLTLMRDVVG